MYPVALSQIGVRVPLDTLKEIDNAMLNFMSLIEWRGDLGIVQREIIKTNDGKQWSYYIPPESELTMGLPFSSTICFSTEKLPEGQKQYEIYISNMVNDLKPLEIAHWLTQVPELINKIIQEDLKKFSERFPRSIPENLKSTGYTDL